jgi:DNA-binding CsgD family transcriptional regulator
VTVPAQWAHGENGRDMDEDVRVGDADRAQAISALEAHCRAGRLDMDELLERSAAAYTARTRAELAALTGDLPGETSEADEVGEPPKRGWRDPAWRLHLTLTVLVNAAVTGLWLVTRDRTPTPTDEGAGYWWPLWLALISGILVLLHYLYAAGRLTLSAWPRRLPAAADARTVPPAIRDPATRADAGGEETAPHAIGLLETLTRREQEVLTLLAEGCANKEIARRLVISERTARTHVSNILRKLQLPSRTQAALVAVEAGLRRDPSPPA